MGVARKNLMGAEIPEFENEGGVLHGVKVQPAKFWNLMTVHLFLHHVLIFNNIIFNFL